MTVIAFDGRTLAADKLACSGDTRQTTTKIFRCGEGLIGITGDLSVGMEMLAWFQEGAAKADFPKSNLDPGKGCCLIVIRPDASVWSYESGPFPFRLEGPFHAFGCGREAALVAMACGKSAYEAVELANMFNTGCGNGVDTLELSA